MQKPRPDEACWFGHLDLRNFIAANVLLLIKIVRDIPIHEDKTSGTMDPKVGAFSRGLEFGRRGRASASLLSRRVAAATQEEGIHTIP